MQSHRTIFSPDERAALVNLAKAIMPAGAGVAAGDVHAVERAEQFLAHLSPTVGKGYRAILAGFRAGARLRHLRGLAKMSSEETLAMANAWRTGDFARRTAFRLLSMPLKAAHYDTREMYEVAGARHGVLTVTQDETPRYMTERVTTATDLGPNGTAETVECDVVVIGTGAGGAVIGKELAEQGLAVVFVEEGQYFKRSELNGHPLDMQRKLYRDMGATVSVGNVSIPIPIGKAVGGTTLINSGTCYRAPARIFSEWHKQFGLQISADIMAPFYARVEEVLNVGVGEARHIGGVGRVIARGCDALGYKHAPLRRNAPGCDGQGVCCFGCPTDAKRSTNVSYMPLGLKAGAHLFTGFSADRILTEGGRAVGIEAHGAGRTLTVRARRVVVAGGSLLSPVLLEKNKLGGASGQLGRNLTIHPAIGALAFYDEIIDGQLGIPQGYAIEEFHEDGLLFEGAFTPPDVAAATLPLIGPQVVELMQSYRNLACFGLMIEDTSRGRVRLGPGGKPLITYWLNDHDVARLKRGVEILSRVYFAGGARKVLPNVHGFDAFESVAEVETFRRAKLSARDFDVTAYHPLGTARMGADSRHSVVGPDLQVHDVPGLYVVDGSIIPSSPAVNPMLTIMALAARAADTMATSLS